VFRTARFSLTQVSEQEKKKFTTVAPRKTREGKNLYRQSSCRIFFLLYFRLRLLQKKTCQQTSERGTVDQRRKFLSEREQALV
jgi:hypothetical protein